MKPPQEILDNKGKEIEAAARFVSLIPYVNDTQLFKDMPDLTCTCQEFLDLGQGDSEEHAILLCNFFNYIDKNTQKNEFYKSYICYGESVPEGQVWYVMRRDIINNWVELWNPSTAQCSNFDRTENKMTGEKNMNQREKDPQCTLKKIWTVVGEDNVWANVQPEVIPVLIQYNLDDPKLWKSYVPMNSKKEYENGPISRLEPSGQLKYQPPMGAHDLRGVEKDTKEYLVRMFEDERIKQVKKITNWNMDIAKLLDDLMGADTGGDLGQYRPQLDFP